MSVGGFSRIAVIGVGLIGGSLAAALKRLPDAPRVVGIDSDTAALRYAVEHGIVDEGAPADDPRVAEWLGAEGVDLVVLATPAQYVREWLRVLGSAGYRGAVTDVASTKAGVLAAVREELADPSQFVGGHPMAGSERSGITAARADLFDGAYWLLTPSHNTDPDLFSAVYALIAAIGARVISVDAAAHDEAVAIVSHVPHVTAAALVGLAAAHSGERGELMRLAAGGFKDTTRIAAGSAELWTGICLDNATALAEGIEELRERLGSFEALVRARDAAAIREWLSSASEIRRSLPSQWVPATSRLLELAVPMLDRPGQVAEITSAVSRVGGNIEGIDIDHQSEDTAVLVLVLTDEGDMGGLLEDLMSRGYEPRLTPLEAAGEDA
ncbi:MAG: prephenate dehydrogenase/arogenate dehydrogenase family protein [Coriobacteriia bacterium]|nr:prephenate dehydrogenase/arogenate dehydrogenase family protein [Coriobacteriia bacterium]